MAAVWATAEHVKTLTDADVTPAQVEQAEAQIEVHAGTVASLSVGLIGARDLHWLRQAVCYQAAWALEQAGLLTRSDVSAAGQDGQSVTFKPDGVVLAPMAKRALRRLSWKGTRSTSPVALGRNRNARMPDDVDDSHAWRPL